MATNTKLTTKERLHQLVDNLDAARADALLTILQGQPPAPEQASEKGPTSGDDPLWRISGMVGDEYAGPTDVSANKYRYVAEHPEVKTD
jgi:hypothetical protein